ncbi:MAG: divalent-cation tolerance protein CutA [Gemmatimonadetes bacterium]|nr:divalent-cation tolerance protein CutA [Gemmatimonadota bacterium]
MSDAEGSNVVAVLTTAPNEEVAERIAETLVEERLAACANVVPGVRSIFRWKGSIAHESEVLVILKTTTESVGALSRRVVELHPYEVPEVIALDVCAGHEPYLDWVRAEIGRVS